MKKGMKVQFKKGVELIERDEPLRDKVGVIAEVKEEVVIVDWDGEVRAVNPRSLKKVKEDAE